MLLFVLVFRQIFIQFAKLAARQAYVPDAGNGEPNTGSCPQQRCCYVFRWVPDSSHLCLIGEQPGCEAINHHRRHLALFVLLPLLQHVCSVAILIGIQSELLKPEPPATRHFRRVQV